MTNNIVLYVELDGQIWMVMTDGNWLPLSDINQLNNDLPLITNIEEIVQMQNSGEYTFSYNDKTFVIDQQAIQYGSTPNFASNNQAQQNDVALSSGGTLGATARLLVDGGEVLADAGHQTRDTGTTETEFDQEDSGELVGKLRSDAQISVSIESGNDAIINQFELPITPIYGISLNLEDGTKVEVVVTDSDNQSITFQAIVVANSWSLGNVDLSALTQGKITVQATVSDAYGNAIGAKTESFIDSLASVDISFESAADDNVINQFEVSNEALFGVIDNIENGQSVSVVITDIEGYSETHNTVINNGKWSLDNLELSAFSEGKLVAIATAKDIAGNIATATTSIIKDTFAQITLTLESGEDGWLNADEIQHASLSGTVEGVEDGRIVQIIATDSAGLIKTISAVIEDGKYSLSDIDLTGVSDGQLNVVAVVTDKAGNPVSTVNNVQVDIQARILTHINSNGDNFLNANEIGATKIWGTTIKVDDGELVTLTVTDVNGDSLTFTTTTTDSLYSISEDLSSLAEGKLTVTAQVTDSVGNPASATDDVIKDTQASITLSIDTGGDGWLNATEILSATASGDAIGIEDGQVVTIVATDSAGNVGQITTTVLDGKFTVSGLDLSGFVDGHFTATATVADAAGNPATAIDTVLIDTAAELSLNINSNGDGVLNAAEVSTTQLHGHTTDVDDGAIVTIVITDSAGKTLSFDAIVNSNSYSVVGDLSSLDEGLLTAVASVTDNQGNSANANAHVEKDTLAEITLVIETGGDDYLNALEIVNVSATGTVTNIEDGNVVTITATDSAGTTASLQVVVVGGQYSLSGLDLSNFVDGDFTVIATVNDNAGNPASTQSDLKIDTLASITVDIESGNDNFINSIEASATTIFGTTVGVENGATIIINVLDDAGKTQSFTTTVLNNRYQIKNADLTSLNEGLLVISAFVTDEHGNQTSDNTSVIKDTLASITIDVESGLDNTLNQDEILTTAIFGSTTNVEDGQSVTVTVSDGTTTLSFTASVLNNSWSIASENLSTLNEGSLTFTATVADIAGNAVNANTQVEKDTLADVTIKFEQQNQDSLLNQIESDNENIFGRVSNIENGQFVSVTVTDSAGTVLSFSTQVVAGLWLVPKSDLSNLLDGELTAQATAIDKAGNESTQITTINKDTGAAITVVIDSKGDEFINAAEVTNVRIYGTVSGVEDGRTVTLTITDNNGNQILPLPTAIVTTGKWSVDNLDLSSLEEGRFVAVAEVTDVAGNIASNQDDAIKDVLAETVITINDNGDGYLNSLEINNVTFSGSVTHIQDGQTVQVIVTDINGLTGAGSATIVDGKWQVDGLDLSHFAEGALQAVATITDTAGNIATATDSVIKDTMAQLTVGIDSNGDNIINFAEQGAVTVFGNVTGVADGLQVVFTVTDGNTTSTEYSATIVGGIWSVDNVDFSSFNEGNITVNASVSDGATNIATANSSVLKDTLANISIDINTSGNLSDEVINLIESTKTEISGTALNVNDGQVVTVVVSDGAGTNLTFTTTVIAQAWSLAAVDLSSLVDGINNINATATVSDIAGNSASAVDITSKDTQASINVTIDSGNDELVNNAEIVAGTRIFGSVNNVEDGQIVTLIINDQAGNEIPFTATVVGGIFEVSGADLIDLSGLQDGLLEVDASVIDVAGNSATATDTAIKDTHVAIDIDTESNNGFSDYPGYNSYNFMNGLHTQLGGTTTAEAGQVVTLTISDGNSSVSFDAVVDGAGRWLVENIDISRLDNSLTWQMQVDVDDVAGNHASDKMPTLNLADHMLLTEEKLNRGPNSATTSLDITSEHTGLAFTDNQPQLSAITSEGQSVTALLSTDGLSIEVRRDGDGKLVLNASIDPLSSSASVTIFEAVDHALDTDSLLTELFIRAEQADIDGTTETVVMPIVFNISDSVPVAVNDSYTVIEDQVAKNNLLSNDSAIDGNPIINAVTFNGVTTVITAGIDAIIDTGKGILTVGYDGNWQFVAAHDVDNSISQQVSFDYQIIDYDGDVSTATVVFDIVDGEAGQMTSQQVSHREPTITQQTDFNKVFTINAGSDDLMPESIAFLNSTLDDLVLLGLQSSSEPITYTLNTDGNTITASSVNGVIFSINVNAVNNGADLTATATFTQYLPIDHINSDQITLPLAINALDSDGTEIKGDLLYWTITDGDNASVVNDSEASINEADLSLGSVVGQGTFEVTPGSDETASVAFDINKQPDLTAGGLSVLYKLDGNGKLIAYTDNPEETAFTVEIIGSFESQSMSDLSYQVTLFKSIDQLSNSDQHLDTLQIAIVVSVTDGDNDISDQNLMINISDSGAPVITGGTFHVTETPLAPSTSTEFSDTATTSVNISADLDPIVDIGLSVNNNDAVLLSDGSSLTQNGEAVLWQANSDGSYKGVLADGTVIFELLLPENIDIAAGTSADVALTFNLLDSVDHVKESHDNVLFLTLPVVAIDSDNSQAIHNINLTINDGKVPALFVSGHLSVDESILLTGSDKDTINYQLDKGSDDVVSVEPLLAGQNIPGIFSHGEAVAFANHANSDGWWIASSSSGAVLKIRFNLEGTIELKLLDVIDHGLAGEDTIKFDLAIQAIDSDGDVSGVAYVGINIVDDIPVATNEVIILEEGQSTQLDLLSQPEISGSDGASITSVGVDGVNYAVGVWVDLLSTDGTLYGRVLINADGTGSIETFTGVYHPGLDILDTINYTITDGDGDIVVSKLLMDIADEVGEVTISTTKTLEDTPLELNLTVSVGDADNNENVEQVIFKASSLQGGTLTLDDVPLGTNGDGDFVLNSSDFTIGKNGFYTPIGALVFQPLLNSSDQTQPISLEVSAEISKDNSANVIVSNIIDLTISSVADTPTWDDAGSTYQYTLVEDGGEQTVSINAVLFDKDGSETLTYQIGTIETGLTLTINGVKINSGDVLSSVEVALIKATPADNFAGILTFAITPIATESENNDSAIGNEQIISFNVAPVADIPELAVVNAKGLEDEIVLLNQVLNGQLNDTDGSESLAYIITVPNGWSVVAINGASAIVTDLGNGKFQVEANDVDAGVVGLLPEAHVSSVTGIFNFSAQAISTESTQEGIAPSTETALSAEHTFEVFLKGVVDAPTVIPTGDWTFDAQTQTIRNQVTQEDALVSLAIAITTLDQDGSENINLLISNLPDGVTITDSLGVNSDLAVVDFINAKPVYQVTLAELQSLYLKPVADFSGLIEFDIQTIITETDGDAKPDGADDNLYQLKVEIDVQPVVDNTDSSVNLSASGKEDLQIPLDLLPNNIADVDGSETVTAFSITGLATGMTLYFDGVEIPSASLPVDLSNYIDTTNTTLASLMDSGRFSVKAPTDASGSFSVAISYEVTDTSGTGVQVSNTFSDNLTVNVSAEVEDLLSPDNDDVADITRLEGIKAVQVSDDGSAISFAGLVTFYDQDDDGSEIIDYIMITVPKGDNWLVTHPNGAIHDGDGHWLIPATGLTSTSVQEVAAEILAGATVYSSEASLLPVSITVGARVLDGDDALMINTNLHVHFSVDGVPSDASDILDLASAPITANEDNSINIGSQTLNSVKGDNNDILSFKISAGDLPVGGTITGSDVIAVYDSSGKVLLGYLFTEASLSNLQLVGISDDFAGTFEVPITAIATDGISGDTRTEVQELQFEIAPIADGVTLIAGNTQIMEDTYSALDLEAMFADSNISGQGIETLSALTLTLPEGGFLKAPVGVLTDNNDGSWTVNDLSKIGTIVYKAPLNFSGEISIGFSAEVIDTASGYSGSMTDAGSSAGTFTIEVLPVTDTVNISTGSSRGDEDTYINLDGLSVSFIDDDGSETMSIEISGVPTGAVLVWNGGTILPNNGTDGGTFNSSPTYKWSISAEQFATLAIKPPLDFSGDIPMKVTVIGYEKGTSDYVTTEGDFVLEVLPIGDDAQFFSVPENLTGVEGQVTHFNVSGASSETNSNETLRLTVKITETEYTQGLDRIRVGAQEAGFVLIGHLYVATLEVNSAEFDGFDLLSGPDTFGLLNLEIALSTIDRAIVGGKEEVHYSDTITFDSTLTLAPVADIPDLTLLADSIFAVVDSNAPLALNLQLINPAADEKGFVEISGVPDGASITNATESGGVWSIAQSDLADAMLSGLTVAQIFELTVVPVAELDGNRVTGVGQSLSVSVVADSVMLSGDNDNNVIVSGPSDNVMSGGNGNDQFVFNNEGQSSAVEDTIIDFSVGSDSINLTDLLRSVSASSGGELDVVMDLSENAGDTIIAVKLDGSNVLQSIVLDNVSMDDLYGASTAGVSESDILTKLLDDQTLITGQG